jgi:hypothetical protein
MQNIFKWAEDAALWETLPDWMSADEDTDIQDGLDGRPNYTAHSDLFHRVEKATFDALRTQLDFTALAETISEARTLALAALKSRHNVTLNETKPWVIVSHPGFLLTDWPPLYSMDDFGFTKIVVKEPAAHWKSQAKMLGHLVHSLCRATNLVFEPYDTRCDSNRKHTGTGSCFIPRGVAAPTWAVCKATGGICEPYLYETCLYCEELLTPPTIHYRPYTICGRPEDVVVVAGMSNSGLMLWAEGIRWCHVEDRGWSFHSRLGAESLRSGTVEIADWATDVYEGIRNVVTRARHKELAFANVSVIATGSCWTDDARARLRQNAEALGMNTTMLDATSKRSEVFGPSMAAAAYGMMSSMDIDVEDLSPLLSFVDHSEHEQLAGYEGHVAHDEL